MDIETLRATMLDGRTKGIPGTAAPFPLSELAGKGWNVLAEDMPLPLLVLKRSNLAHNARMFDAYLAATGLSLAPHGKTTMAPQNNTKQLTHNTKNKTKTTNNQQQDKQHYGVGRIVLANQLLGRAH